ncbi:MULTISPECIES: helix-turn-helix transcriptional regulator [unclassified Solwaraspora]|uniref:helix-turn-helix domain-containing protein n=1 Tax=unclassified Solwaraspora TaxID=2627926 RepID=UPI00248BE5D3|nr:MULTISPECIES: helix-turn-helix transcriptional regulator [unclassified Solwaraspora]WBB98395.1 helix-turn-helix transcriptional regulator [Solwaraspora sp. WMMA2059]WBC23052.1 helix-turn-helix transcriptional regulator [Solwaraspora sp. WMMA2080]WJK34914.1 helix-turn-helix transcriptional regulator [Solwaraspora sp. WMMA2065]
MSGAASAYLIAELRRRRELAGLTQEQWGAALHWSAQHVSAVERGARPIRLDYLATIDRVFNCDYSTLWELLLRTERAPVWLRPWLEHEREAIMLRWYEPLLVPGLLQTEAYARVVLTHAGVAIDDVDTTVGDRLGRQEILHRAERPCRFVGVIDEAVLTRAVGGPAVMREQVLALIAACDRPNVSIQVVPAGVGAYPGLNGPFILASLDGRAAGFVDGPLEGQTIELEADLTRLEHAWESLREYALPSEQSVALMQEAADRWA